MVHAAKLLPGEYYVSLHNELIVTVLGSCVSACIRDNKLGIGGMNHFMLPINTRDDTAAFHSDISAATRYGNYAMEHLINAILKSGGLRRNLEVKIFGGGRILAHMSDVGHKNIEFVRHYLETEALAVSAEDVGGAHPRKVQYFPATGKVRVKMLRALKNKTIVQREKEYLSSLKRQPVSGEIELF